MYSTKTAVFDSYNNNYMPAGINENVTLKSVDVLKSPTNRDYIEITFENENGATASFTEWKVEKNTWIKTDEDLQNRENQQFGRILQVLNCYFETIEDVELNSFTEMIKWVESKLKSVDTSKKLRLKVSYDNKGFIRVSQYGTFVEPMSVEETKIVKTGRDKFVRPVIKIDDESVDPLTNTISVSASVDGTNSTDDLPF